jgi:hypothetical protein
MTECQAVLALRLVNAAVRADKDAYETVWRDLNHPRRSLLACQRVVFLDLGAGWLLNLRKLHPGPPYGGWGYLMTRSEFIDRALPPQKKEKPV